MLKLRVARVREYITELGVTDLDQDKGLGVAISPNLSGSLDTRLTCEKVQCYWAFFVCGGKTVALSKAVFMASPLLKMHPKYKSCKSTLLMSRFLNLCTFHRGIVKLFGET